MGLLACLRAANGPTLGAAAGTTTLLRLYHKNVVDHYSKPRNVGSFDKNDPNVGTGLVGEWPKWAGGQQQQQKQHSVPHTAHVAHCVQQAGAERPAM